MRYGLVVLLSTFVTGCGLMGSTETITYEDEGKICLSGSPFGGDRSGLEAGEPLEAMVVFNDCLSSSCSDFEPTSCSIDVDGDTVTITSEGSYVDTTQRERACTSDCRVLSAECTGPELEEGTYTFVHGDASYEVNVPGSEEESGCLE